jgi:hypothetical protein
LFKKLDFVLGSRKIASGPTAAGTTEFLNLLPKKRDLKPYYYDKYYLWHNVILNFALKNFSGCTIVLLQIPVFRDRDFRIFKPILKQELNSSVTSCDKARRGEKIN